MGLGGERGGDRTYRLNRRLRRPLDGGWSQLGSFCGARRGRDLLCVSDSHRVGMVVGCWLPASAAAEGWFRVK